jgi:predicted nucleic acid-binding protein
VNVYVESNFVLELSLLQEQWESCEEILKLCEAGRVDLVVPAYCLTEPYGTLTQRQKRRRKMRRQVDQELDQMARTAIYAEQLGGFRELANFLIKSAEDDDRRLGDLCSRLLNAAQVIPLNSSILTASTGYRNRYGFSPQDSFVYASVLSHLERDSSQVSCFLNRDKDFEDEDVVGELSGLGCELFFDFDAGYRFIVDIPD